MSKEKPGYEIVISEQALEKITEYKNLLIAKATPDHKPGSLLAEEIEKSGIPLDKMSNAQFIEVLMSTKKPRIFAESEVSGDGQDWNEQELKILGDINVTVPVKIYDNGVWNPKDPSGKFAVHETPFEGELLFTPGALLKNKPGPPPPDRQEVVKNGTIDQAAYIDQTAYNDLVERRLLPLLVHASDKAGIEGKPALITLPGVGAGAFAGEFTGKVGEHFNQALQNMLQKHGSKLGNIAAIHYDSFRECENEQKNYGNIKYRVRPQLKGNEGKAQLCAPETYQEAGDDFSNCKLYKIVAWDHVSLPGNDYFAGVRTTDDGVVAAATNSMEVITGIKGGKYDGTTGKFLPPEGLDSWEKGAIDNKVKLRVENNLKIVTNQGKSYSLAEFEKLQPQNPEKAATKSPATGTQPQVNKPIPAAQPVKAQEIKPKPQAQQLSSQLNLTPAQAKAMLKDYREALIDFNKSLTTDRLNAVRANGRIIPNIIAALNAIEENREFAYAPFHSDNVIMNPNLYLNDLIKGSHEQSGQLAQVLKFDYPSSEKFNQFIGEMKSLAAAPSIGKEAKKPEPLVVPVNSKVQIYSAEGKEPRMAIKFKTQDERDMFVNSLIIEGKKEGIDLTQVLDTGHDGNSGVVYVKPSLGKGSIGTYKSDPTKAGNFDTKPELSINFQSNALANKFQTMLGLNTHSYITDGGSALYIRTESLDVIPDPTRKSNITTMTSYAAEVGKTEAKIAQKATEQKQPQVNKPIPAAPAPPEPEQKQPQVDKPIPAAQSAKVQEIKPQPAQQPSSQLNLTPAQAKAMLKDYREALIDFNKSLTTDRLNAVRANGRIIPNIIAALNAIEENKEFAYAPFHSDNVIMNPNLYLNDLIKGSHEQSGQLAQVLKFDYPSSEKFNQFIGEMKSLAAAPSIGKEAKKPEPLVVPVNSEVQIYSAEGKEPRMAIKFKTQDERDMFVNNLIIEGKKEGIDLTQVLDTGHDGNSGVVYVKPSLGKGSIGTYKSDPTKAGNFDTKPELSINFQSNALANKFQTMLGLNTHSYITDGGSALYIRTESLDVIPDPTRKSNITTMTSYAAEVGKTEAKIAQKATEQKQPQVNKPIPATPAPPEPEQKQPQVDKPIPATPAPSPAPQPHITQPTPSTGFQKITPSYIAKPAPEVIQPKPVVEPAKFTPEIKIPEISTQAQNQPIIPPPPNDLPSPLLNDQQVQTKNNKNIFVKAFNAIKQVGQKIKNAFTGKKTLEETQQPKIVNKPKESEKVPAYPQLTEQQKVKSKEIGETTLKHDPNNGNKINKRQWSKTGQKANSKSNGIGF